MRSEIDGVLPAQLLDQLDEERDVVQVLGRPRRRSRRRRSRCGTGPRRLRIRRRLGTRRETRSPPPARRSRWSPRTGAGPRTAVQGDEQGHRLGWQRRRDVEVGGPLTTVGSRDHHVDRLPPRGDRWLRLRRGGLRRLVVVDGWSAASGRSSAHAATPTESRAIVIIPNRIAPMRPDDHAGL